MPQGWCGVAGRIWSHQLHLLGEKELLESIPRKWGVEASSFHVQGVFCWLAFPASPSPGGDWSSRRALESSRIPFSWERSRMGSSWSWQLWHSPAPKSTPQDTTFGLKCQLSWNSLLLVAARRIQALLNHFRDKQQCRQCGGCSLGRLFPVSMPWHCEAHLLLNLYFNPCENSQEFEQLRSLRQICILIVLPHPQAVQSLQGLSGMFSFWIWWI